MDRHWDSADQLHSELQASIRRALQRRRPIITHINADTTWLIQLPRDTLGREALSERRQFNILIDPWLTGGQSDVAVWFSTQWHSVPSSVRAIAELEDYLYEIDCLARADFKKDTASSRVFAQSYIDLVVISHEFTDHCHRATLTEVNCDVPVFATEKARSLIKSWHHFKTVVTIPPFRPGDTDWRETSIEPLPKWLGVSRVVSPGNALYYHSGILLTFKRSRDTTSVILEDESAEAIIYTPHGIEANDLAHLPSAIPPIHTLALMHGLHDVGMTRRFQLNLGAHNGLRANRILKARYWVGTHDEVKKGGGLIAPLLRRAVFTLQEALDKESRETGAQSKHDQVDKSSNDVNFAELGSGESLLLL